MKFNRAIITVLLSIGSLVANAEIVVIVHPSNSVSSLDEGTVQQLFLGKLSSFPGGEKAVPITLSDGNEIRNEFNSSVLKKSDSQYKAFWTKMMFTGKGVPPKEVGTSADIIDLVKKNPSLVGYVDAASVTGDVKVVAKF